MINKKSINSLNQIDLNQHFICIPSSYRLLVCLFGVGLLGFGYECYKKIPYIDSNGFMLAILHERSGDIICYCLAIYLSVFLPNMPYISNVLPNLIEMLNTFGDNGIVGFIALVTLVGHFFIAYYLYNFFKQYRDKTQPL